MWTYTVNNIHVRDKITSMGKIKRMDQVKLILKLFLQTGSFKATARKLKISKNTVKHYVRQAQEFDHDLNKTLSLEQDSFFAIL